MNNITVKSHALAAVLNEIAKWSDNLNDELTKIARETAQAQEALAAGNWIAFTPDTAKVSECHSKREALISVTKALGVTAEELAQAMAPGRPYFMGG